jgi:hypothetical protein
MAYLPNITLQEACQPQWEKRYVDNEELCGHLFSPVGSITVPNTETMTFQINLKSVHGKLTRLIQVWEILRGEMCKNLYQ